MSGKDTKTRRKRYGQLPVPDARADLYWGVTQPELQDVSDGQLTALLMATPEFTEVLGAKLEAIDARNQTIASGKSMGRPSRWSAWQLESVLLYRRVAGLETIKRTQERLHWDVEAQQLLGLEDGLPSLKTMSRYMRERVDETERAKAYRELDRRLRQRVVRLPGFDEEAWKLGLDGSQHGTRYTPPIPERGKDGKLTGKIVNGEVPVGEPRAITAADAGYVGGNHPKSGKGWQFMGLFSEHGTLVSWDISALNEGETTAAERVLDAYEIEVLPHRGQKMPSVCSADGAFDSPILRSRMQELRIVPNIHRASHSKKPTTEKHVAKLDKAWVPFRHPTKPCYANWKANGHLELRCKCKAGITKRVVEVSKNGYLTIATKGQCQTCGNITITSGKWRRVENPARFVRAYRNDEADPAIGNPLTYNDKLSEAYGQDRFGFGESVHATIERRFGLLKDKSWMRSITEVETEFAIAASAISVLLLEREARQNSSAGLASETGSNRPVEAMPLAA